MVFKNQKRPFPATWGEEGVDVSRDSFVAPIGGKPVGRHVYVGASFKFPKEDGRVPLEKRLVGNPKDVEKYICMVGNCSGVIGPKPKKKIIKEEEE